jgi:hypothetical protein
LASEIRVAPFAAANELSPWARGLTVPPAVPAPEEFGSGSYAVYDVWDMST